jgi:hypothetical protein
MTLDKEKSAPNGHKSVVTNSEQLAIRGFLIWHLYATDIGEINRLIQNYVDDQSEGKQYDTR